MRSYFLAILLLLQGAAAIKHRFGSHRHHARQHQQHHSKRRSSFHHTASFAQMQHALDDMVEHTSAAEAELTDTCRRLEEALLDVALQQNVNATPAMRGASKLPGNLSSTLKVQQGKLTELFKHLKTNIAQFNKREADEKKDSQGYADNLKKRLAADKKKLENSDLSAFDREMLVNRTRTEEHELKFWTRGRELQHDMFHSNLKLTHGLMSRVKTVMEAYEQVLKTGKLDAKLTKVLHATSSSLPKALIQKEARVNRDVRKIEKHLKIGARLFRKK